MMSRRSEITSLIPKIGRFTNIQLYFNFARVTYARMLIRGGIVHSVRKNDLRLKKNSLRSKVAQYLHERFLF